MTAKTDLYLSLLNSIDFEKIKDHPNILIAANFWEPDRYQAAQVCYKLMRTVDDLVDNYKSTHLLISEDEKFPLEEKVKTWIGAILEQTQSDQKHNELLETYHRFCLPAWPMESFAKSMIYDIYHDGFDTLQTFLDYAEGASVAPAAIFVHLCGLKQIDGVYAPPAFEVKDAARPCAVFSYLVHIIRDFQKDQFNHLNYFSDDILQKNDLDHAALRAMAHGAPIESGFRNLIKEYYLLADVYRQKTYEEIVKIRPFLEPRYQLSLEIIFNLYLMVFERIDFKNGKFTTEELNPTPAEVKKRVYDTISGFVFDQSIS